MLAAAGCSRVSRYIRFLGCDGYGGVAVVRENPVAVGEVDRRVLVVGIDTELGLIKCVWIGNTARHSTQSSRDAGRDFWFQPKELTRLTVVTENRQERK